MRLWGVRNAAVADGEITADAGELRTQLHEAYRRGRRDEYRRRRRSPLITGSLIAIAAVGAVVLYFAAQQGSFAGGGQVVDAQLTHATTQVIPSVVNDATDRAGTALQSAGERLKAQGVTASPREEGSSAGK